MKENIQRTQCVYGIIAAMHGTFIKNVFLFTFQGHISFEILETHHRRLILSSLRKYTKNLIVCIAIAQAYALDNWYGIPMLVCLSVF